MLNNRWYPLLETAALRKKPIGIKRLGMDLVLWRDLDGEPRALPAACPHRGASLAGGRVVGGELECPWHAFRFDGRGRCTTMPCEGPDARVPRALNVSPFPIREQYSLVWMWWGEERASYPEIPFFSEVEDRGGFTETSYVLPYHYSRMVETNLDVHHTPIVHGNVVPLGKRVIDFDARLEGDQIYSSGRFIREKHVARNDGKGMPFTADLILPNLVHISLTPKLHILVCATPVDETHSWLWFRYCQSYTPIKMLGKLITWISVTSELRVVQKQDWRIFADMTPGTIDDFNYGFVHSDKAIALYRKLRQDHLNFDRMAQAEPPPPENENKLHLHSAASN